MKTHNRKKKLFIEYKIVSRNCLKSIVQGTRMFDEDSKALSFIKRLNKVKNTLCERADKDSFTEAMQNAKRFNSRYRNFPSSQITKQWGTNDLPYSLTYSCNNIR